jgi:hypothetical protein
MTLRGLVTVQKQWRSFTPTRVKAEVGIGAAMANRVSVPIVTDGDIDALAREFVNSTDPAHAYPGWSIDRRIEAFLRHRDLAAVANNGDLCNILVNRILTYAGIARRST